MRTKSGVFQDVATLVGPTAMAHDDSGDRNTYIADPVLNQIVRLMNGFATRFGSAGAGAYAGDGSHISDPSVRFNAPSDVLFAPELGQFLYILDTGNHCIRRFATSLPMSNQIIGVFSGTCGVMGTFRSPEAFANLMNRIFVADTGNHVIVEVVGAAGEITTRAGQKGVASSADGSGETATFSNPAGIAIDAARMVAYISCYSTHSIRAMSLQPPFAVTTAAGTVGPGYFDGPALGSAQFNMPRRLAFNANDRILLVADSQNNRIRAYNVDHQTVSTVAGNTAGKFDAGKIVSDMRLDIFRSPQGIFFDATTNTVFVLDTGNSHVTSIMSSSAVCSAGSYCATQGLSAPQGPCDPGYYCTDGSVNPRQNICTSEGYYCPSGSSSPMQVACPLGAFCRAGASAPAVCLAGYACATTGLTAPSFACSVNTFSAANATACSPCPEMSYAHVGASECTSCGGACKGAHRRLIRLFALWVV